MQKKNKFFLNTIFLFILICFSSIFILSLFKIVNFWSFSQAHVNYFGGFIKRGLFGTIIILIENTFRIEPKKTFAVFFILLTLVNIFLFLILINKYSENKILYIFIALNPTLILFSFNDLGGYQRFDSISIAMMLFHSLLAFNYNSKKINIATYKKSLYFFIFPLILISLFIHEIQAWSIPLHFLITYNIEKDNYKKVLITYLLFLIPISFIFFYPVSHETFEEMTKYIKNKDLWFDAMEFSASSAKNISVMKYEIQTNLLNTYNLTINIFFIVMATVPFYIILIFLKKNNCLISNNLNNYFFIISIFPFLTLFFIGDTGRWINIMSFAALSYLGQFPLKDKINILNKINNNKNKFFLKIFFLLVVLIYVFFTRLPHCCDLQRKGITIWGGFIEKSFVLIKILQKDQSDYYNINKRFRE